MDNIREHVNKILKSQGNPEVDKKYLDNMIKNAEKNNFDEALINAATYRVIGHGEAIKIGHHRKQFVNQQIDQVSGNLNTEFSERQKKDIHYRAEKYDKSLGFVCQDIYHVAGVNEVVKDMIDKAKEQGVDIPKKQVDLISTSLERKDVSFSNIAKYMEQVVDRVKEEKNRTHWVKPDEEKVYAQLEDDKGNPKAIVEIRQNKETQQEFCALKLVIPDKAGEHKITTTKVTSSNGEVVKNIADKMQISMIMNEVREEFKQELKSSKTKETKTARKEASGMDL